MCRRTVLVMQLIVMITAFLQNAKSDVRSSVLLRISIEYVEDLSDIFDHRAATRHLYADDMHGQCGGPM